MKIVIAGAGEVGFHLAKLLSDQSQDIFIIDTDSELLDHARSKMDVFTVLGDSTSVKTLKEAQVRQADLLIAVTSSEQANIITAAIGKKMGAKKTVARIEKEEYLLTSIQEDFVNIGIDNMFSPRQLASAEICKLVEQAALSALQEFEEGKLSLVGVTLTDQSPIVGHSLAETSSHNPDDNYKAIAILRGHRTIIPRGNTKFEDGDQVFFISTKEGKLPIIHAAGSRTKPIKKVMILGGSRIGALVAQRLEKKYQVKLIEMDRDRCYNLAESLNNTLVINGDGCNVELLEEEGLAECDVFIALTGNSETNIISCLVAKNHNVKKTIASVENVDYINISQEIGVDALINRKLIFANDIFTYLRKGAVKSLHNLHGTEAEVIEYEVGKDAAISAAPVRELDFPKSALIGGVIRGEECFVATGDTKIMEEDKVVVFSLPEAIKQVESFFSA